ncbi:MAG TPA: DUF5724 domain-containing protein, partial [Planctomycetia bacterium]|nr:DUF5724 domain-containing protein [Planctomycetia bacterium]
LRTLTCSVHPLDPHERSWSDGSDDKTYLAWAERHFGKPPKLKHPRIVEDLALWFTRLAGWPLSAFPADALLDYFENSLADSPLVGPKPSRKKKDEFEDSEDWREHSWATEWLTEAWRGFETCMSEAQRRRAWGLLCWFDRPGNGWPRRRPEKSQLLEAHDRGIATDDDVLDHLIGPRTEIPGYYGSEEHGLLRDLTDTPSTGRWDRGKTREAHPRAAALADGVCARILGIELARGENPTSVTAAVLSVSCWPGLETLVSLHRALGRAANARIRGWKKADGRIETFSQMIDRSVPAPGDTPEKFAAAMKEFGEAKILQQAFDTPAWIEHVVFALGWPGLKEAIYWFLAHTRQSNRPTEEGAWERVLAERTPLTEAEIREGAVDIEWFHRVYKAVGPKRWGSLVEASKYGADGQGHKAALQLADALLGKTKTVDLIAKIKKANSREAVRLLGLVPLPAGAKREKELKTRYAALQEYLRYAKKLSAMTKEGALRTAEIGFANLARTAGYADPIRFAWAMERETVADLEKGPVAAKAGAVTVTLAIDEEGTPSLTASKDGKPLKVIPAEAKKHAKVAPLAERLADLRKQKPRCKEALERMMIRGDSLSGEEVRDLSSHPILAPLLSRLVLLGKDLAGYPVKGGAALQGHDGEALALKKTDSVRIAHPCDLFAAKSWAAFQRDCFAREVIQPFKQVFRELYVPTKTELDEKNRSRRYAGQQVNPTQAKALFGARGWTVDAYESVSKTFHDDKVAVDVGFLYGGGTSVDVEGWTVETVTFRKLREHEPVAPGEVPPRLFSEVMRDLDLVVSVAHCGGVDP